jgi:hypothetical protein
MAGKDVCGERGIEEHFREPHHLTQSAPELNAIGSLASPLSAEQFLDSRD